MSAWLPDSVFGLEYWMLFVLALGFLWTTILMWFDW
jgi:hypothetical protein